MGFVRFIFFVLAVAIVVGFVGKYLILFLLRAKKTEEKVYDKLEKKMLPEEPEEDSEEESGLELPKKKSLKKKK